jgi:sugar phosphate isomerase/epimerase
MAITTLPLGVTAVMLPELDFAEQLALLKSLGLTHYSIRPRYIADDQRGKPWGNWGNHKFDLTPERLVKEGQQIRRQLDDAGITPFGTVPAISVDDADDVLKLSFEGAQIVGAGRVRVAPPGWAGYPKGQAFNYQDVLKKTVDGYGRAVALAKPYGQKIVIETHGNSIAASPALALNICKEFSPAELGTIFDIANFNLEGNYVPNLAVAVLRDYIDHVHIGGSRRVATTYDANGFLEPGWVGCPITEAHLYMPAWLKALHDAGAHVPLLIENYQPNLPGAVRLTETAAALRRALESLN